MIENIKNIRKKLRRSAPLIHCITNPISITRCADALLAVGARPIMAEHPAEVEEITASADALMLNLGNITDARLSSVRISAAAAAKKGIPVVLDAVGVACSRLRRRLADELIAGNVPTVIKGNYSEMIALHDRGYSASGVDTQPELSYERVRDAAYELARRYHTIVLASGKCDIVTDGARVICVKNGTPQLAGITGTGCMLGALCAAYLSVQADIYAAAAACAVLGVCGELSETVRGNGSFGMNLMDKLSCLRDTELEKYFKAEVGCLEEF